MRNFFSLVLSFFIIMAAVPVVSLMYKEDVVQKITAVSTAKGESKSENTQNESTARDEAEKAEAASENDEKSTQNTAKETAFFTKKADKVKVYLHKEKKTVTVDTRFYVLSVLAKEIDIGAPKEALKAQAVCIYTFLKHSMENADSSKYDITDDPAHHQAFLNETALKAFWGESYQENYEKLGKIVDAVSGEYLSYEGKSILAAYHSSNAGKTESAANYWGEDYPYLTPVNSIGDTLCNTYKTKVSFTPATLKKALLTLKNKNFVFPDSPSDWVGELQSTPSGTVTSITIGGVPLSGREVREALKLKSSFFTIRYESGKFSFKVSGYGHGVGLSQEGAKYMAKLGFDYQSILLHYYNGVAIKQENSI